MNIEAATIGEQHREKHVFANFTEANVVRMAELDAAGEWMSMRDLPSYEAAMRHLDMCHEVFSLMPVMTDMQIVMSQDEVRAMIEQNCPYSLGEDVRVPGWAGLSRFGEVYDIQ